MATATLTPAMTRTLFAIHEGGGRVASAAGFNSATLRGLATRKLIRTLRSGEIKLTAAGTRFVRN